jgi:hypothetical protein
MSARGQTIQDALSNLSFNDKDKNSNNSRGVFQLLPPTSSLPIPSASASSVRRLCPIPADVSLYTKVLASIPRSIFDKMMFKMQLEQRQIDMESSEIILEYTQISDIDEIQQRRKKDLVYEDHFNPTILNMAKNRFFSFDKLKKVCKKYESKSSLNEHIKRSHHTYKYFVEKKGLSEDEALGCAFAIAFYTGSKQAIDDGNQYYEINRASSVIARKGNGEAVANVNEKDMKDSTFILYYLIHGLAHIPYHWGICSQAIFLNDEQLGEYEPGSLVSWFQFSSSMERHNAPPHFTERSNTFFKIYSATGRSIKNFSIFEEEEEEVLFLPHSTFLVVDHTLSFNGKKHFINLRQVELGLSEYSVLWVDDHIFSEKWQSKGHMEMAATCSLNINVHFVPNVFSFVSSQICDVIMKNQLRMQEYG